MSVHETIDRLRETSHKMFEYDDPDTNPPLIDWSADVDDGLQLIEDLVTLVRKMATQVEITAPKGREPALASGWDTHGSETLTDAEYDLVRAVQRGR